MTGGDPVAAAADRLRAAVVSAAYEEARGLLAEYCTQVEAALRAGRADPERNSQIAGEAQALFVWVRNMTLAAQAHAAARLQRLAAAAAYELPANPALRIWDIQA